MSLQTLIMRDKFQLCKLTSWFSALHIEVMLFCSSAWSALLHVLTSASSAIVSIIMKSKFKPLSLLGIVWKEISLTLWKLIFSSEIFYAVQVWPSSLVFRSLILIYSSCSQTFIVATFCKDACLLCDLCLTFCFQSEQAEKGYMDYTELSTFLQWSPVIAF